MFANSILSDDSSTLLSLISSTPPPLEKMTYFNDQCLHFISNFSFSASFTSSGENFFQMNFRSLIWNGLSDFSVSNVAFRFCINHEPQPRTATKNRPQL